MKQQQYKLIKEYPGSPKLGFIFKMYNGYKGDYGTMPEFWEKVVELDYEILSFISKRNELVTKKENGKFSTHPLAGYYAENVYLLSNDYNIYSVKRLSDNTVWTIGNRYEVKDPIKEFRTIDKFYISNNKLYIVPKEFGYSELKELYKVKQPLCKTEDGVNIYDGDTIFGVTVNWQIFYHSHDLEHKIKHWGKSPILSTKEAAEKYILMNKPCLSIKDCIGLTSWFNMEEDLKELVKSKLTK